MAIAPLIVLLLFGSSASATTTVALLELTTPPTMMGLGRQVLSELESAAIVQGFTVLSTRQLQDSLGAARWQELIDCGEQVGCVTSKLQGSGVDRVVVGRLDRDDKAYVLKLKLVDVATTDVLSHVDRSILIASRRFRQDVAEAAPRFLRGELEARGRLEITANAADVEVWIDDRSVGKTPLTLELKPGKYQVRLEKPGYLAIRRLVTVESVGVSRNDFRLVPEPGAPADQDPAIAREGTGATPERQLKVPLPAWIALGAGVAAAGTGAYFGTAAQRTERGLSSGYDETTGIYSGTRVSALGGRRDARTANYFFIGAGVAALTSVLLTVLHSGDPTPPTVTPAAGPRGAGVQIEGTF